MQKSTTNHQKETQQHKKYNTNSLQHPTQTIQQVTTTTQQETQPHRQNQHQHNTQSKTHQKEPAKSTRTHEKKVQKPQRKVQNQFIIITFDNSPTRNNTTTSIHAQTTKQRNCQRTQREPHTINGANKNIGFFFKPIRLSSFFVFKNSPIFHWTLSSRSRQGS